MWSLYLTVVTFCYCRWALYAKEFPPPKIVNATMDIMSVLLEGYDRGNVPTNPTNVYIGIYINSIDSISEQSMDYSINIYLRQTWNDPRLRFRTLDGQNISKIKTEDGAWKQIWVPDVFFRNEKRATFHYITIPNRLLWIYPDGQVYYSSKISATLSCAMQLHKYPLDKQVCPMEFESFGHTMDDLVYKWRTDPVEADPTLQMPQFRLINNTLIDCSQNYSSGAFPCLQINFHLKRDIGYYMIQIYVPSVLVVILSWVAFWINVDAVPARVTIGLLTGIPILIFTFGLVLTTTTQSTGARSQLPRVSYIKAIDIWLSSCLLFVFASLLEFAVVNVFSRKAVIPSSNGEEKSPETKRQAKNPFRRMLSLVDDEEESIGLQPLTSRQQQEPIVLVTHNGRDFVEKREIRPAHLRCRSTGQSPSKSQAGADDSNTNDAAAAALSAEEKERAHSRGRLLLVVMRGSEARATSTPWVQALRIDLFSRVCFPFAFILFNAIYWTFYLTADDEHLSHQ